MMSALLRQVADLDTAREHAGPEIRAHWIMADALTGFGASSKMNARSAVVSLLKQPRARCIADTPMLGSRRAIDDPISTRCSAGC